MRKHLAVLLIALLLMQTLFVPVSANQFNDGQLNWGDCTHEYDNVCDPTCNKCEVTRRVPDHVTDRPGCATAPCIHCGATVPATEQHTYDNACDPTCNECDATRGVNHAYDNACDATCNLCGAIRSVADHVTDSPVCVDGVCVHCGVAVPATEQHAYDNACDDNCNRCGEIRPVKGHVYSGDADTVCDLCGAIRVPQEPGADRTPGDVNADGAVNNKDLVLMIRCLSGWKVQIHIAAADVNGDGALSLKDAARLQQYLNGWDVTLL